jgi:hypothetical protein
MSQNKYILFSNLTNKLQAVRMTKTKVKKYELWFFDFMIFGSDFGHRNMEFETEFRWGMGMELE